MQIVEFEAGEYFSSFELLNRASMEIAINHSVDVNYPFKSQHEWFALIDLKGTINTNQALETILSQALKNNIIDALYVTWMGRHKSVSLTNCTSTDIKYWKFVFMF